MRGGPLDLVLSNATILTMDPRQPTAGAIGFADGRIAWLGDPDEAADLVEVGRRIDLGGATVLPGFNDAHHHLLLLGQWLMQVDCSFPAVRSVEDIVMAVAAAAERTPGGEWIEARGYDDNKLDERRHPTRWDLDRAAPNHPVRLRNASGHMCVVNTRALELAGITRDTVAPFGGAVHLDPVSGDPSGLLQESAQQLLSRTYGAQDPAELRKALDIGSRAYLAAGVTSSQEAGIFHRNEFAVLQEAWMDHRLPLRTYLMLRIPFLDAMEQMGVFTGFGDDRLKLGALKLLSDGSLIGRTAAVSQPFLEDPRPDNLGLPSWTQAELDELIWRGHSAGWQVAIHAIGDRAIEMCLDGYERALQRKPRPDHRHRLEHCGILRSDLIRRIKQLGVIPVGQPPFIIEFGDGFLRHLGRERCQLTYPLRSFLDAGVPVAGSSDSPVSDFRPLLGIQAAVEQRTASGQDFARGEQLTVEEAIALYTRSAAYASFDETRKGTLTPGKLADLVILASDPRNVAPHDISQVRVLATFIGGEMVYEAPIAATTEA